MPNDRLRDALLTAEITPARVAERLEVDPKTVERWITTSRVPYPRHRHAVAVMVQESETYLWPSAADPERVAEISRSEIVKLYPHRSVVPVDLWDRLLAASTAYVDVLVYVGMFMTEKPDLIATLRRKAADGAFFRPLAGVPDIGLRTHGTVLYNSIYRFDDEMIVNPHGYGKIASHAPAMHLRRLSAGDLFTTYANSFTPVWKAAAPYRW